ncbi:MAG: ABC transporter substrate-binding protein [Oscillospiraceae bacterium]|jgi:peptide/nickel transport system substrate-binding protein
MKTKQRWLSFALCGVLTLSMLAGCGGGDSTNKASDDKTTNATTEDAKTSENKVLRLVFPSTVTTLDISDGDGATMLKEVAQVVETLVNVDSNFKLTPSLATSWERTGDFTWEIKLREDVKFHDGSDFNADAVKWCFERAAKENSSFTAYTAIESVDVIDEYTVQLNTNIKTGEIPEALTNVAAAIVAPSSVDKDGNFVKPIGTGYFKYKDFDVSTGDFSCDVFEDYWGGEQDSSIQEREIRAISDSSTRSLAVQNGEVDVVTDVPFTDLYTLQDNPDLNVLKFNTARTYFYTYNLNKEYLADPNVRKALIYAIDREEIVNDVLLGVGGVPNGIFMDDVPWNNAEVDTYDYDLEKAKQLLDDAGFKDSDGDDIREYNGEEVTLNIVTGSRRPGNPLIVQATQGYFEKLGIHATVEVLDGTALSDAQSSGAYDLYLSSAATGYIPSASYYLYQYYYSESNNAKLAGYSNPELDKLLEECKAETDIEKKYELSRQAQALAQEDAAIYTVALYGAVFAMNSDVTGFEYSAAVHDFIVPYSTDLK